MEEEINVDLRPLPGTKERAEYDEWEKKVWETLARLKELDQERELHTLITTNPTDAIMYLRERAGTDFDETLHAIARRIGENRKIEEAKKAVENLQKGK